MTLLLAHVSASLGNVMMGLERFVALLNMPNDPMSKCNRNGLFLNESTGISVIKLPDKCA